MTITQIECFVEVAKFGNVSRAAESLFITQQAVSGQIKSLEKELGFPLFERKSKGVALTKEGEILFADWEQIRNTLRISIDKARDYHSGRNEHIRIGLADMGKCSEDIMASFFQYQQKYKELTIDYELMTPIQMIQLFENGELDMAILYQSEFERQIPLKCIPLHRKLLNICIYMSKNHPLAQKEDLSLVHLEDETLGVLSGCFSLDYRKKQNSFFSYYGLEVPKNKKEYASRRELEMALIAGRCVAVVYEPMFYGEESMLYKKALDMPQVSTRISLYWKEDAMDTKARSLADILKANLIQFD